MAKRKSKRGRCARNAQKGAPSQEPEELSKAPHSFVINRGKLGKNANELLLNFRKLMEPYTASQLKVKRKNTIKDFIHIAGPLNVTHMVIFTKSAVAMYMKLAKLTKGPTLTFRIQEYCLARDVLSSLKKAVVYQKLFDHHPLLVLNNFSGEGLHFKLMISMFQGMFPSINVHKTNLNTIRRCILVNYNSEDKTIDIRHYAVKIVPCGMSKPVKKLIQSKIPDLGQYNNFSEFLIDPGNLSESEVEFDGPANQVILPQPISSRGNIVSQRSAIRLCELGPRLKLQLVKIEEEVMAGDILYHEFVTKTPEEVKAIKAALMKRRVLKEQRKAVQAANVRRKEQEKAAHKQQNNSQGGEVKNGADADDEGDDDEEWYRKEVGENPDEDVLPKKKQESGSLTEGTHRKRKSDSPLEKPAKKQKSVSFSGVPKEFRPKKDKFIHAGSVPDASQEEKDKRDGKEPKKRKSFQTSLEEMRKRKNSRLKVRKSKRNSLKVSANPGLRAKAAQKKKKKE